MTYRKTSFLKHFINAFVWTACTGLIAFAPLLFLKIINVMSEENVAAMEINHLFNGKVILFISCAVTAAVVIDFILSKFTVTGWLAIFAIYISPFCLLAYLFLKYLLVYVQFGEQHDFGPGVLTTTVTVAFAIAYCLFVKTIYYIKQENAGRHIHL